MSGVREQLAEARAREVDPVWIAAVEETAGQIAARGNGIPSATAVALADRVLQNCVGWRPHDDGFRRQDVDYVARILQALNEVSIV